MNVYICVCIYMYVCIYIYICLTLSSESQDRSEETTNLLAEKARVAEEESGLLLRKAADLEKEILRLNLVMSEVSSQVDPDEFKLGII